MHKFMPTKEIKQKLNKLLAHLLTYRHLPWQAYMGLGSRRRVSKLSSASELAEFINTRASHVAQTSLYGYLRTRAGTRYPELFERDDMLSSINTAKWRVWLACANDLLLFSGRLLYLNNNYKAEQVGELLSQVSSTIIEQVGNPEEADADFFAELQKLPAFVAAVDWQQLAGEGEDSCFSSSADALFYWAPISDELKQYDEEIVRNSIRFRWHELRIYARQHWQMQIATPLADG